jgi:hypothetical protein
MGRVFAEARSISLPTCGEETAFSESTSTNTFAALIARIMPSAYRPPGGTSRGAIQQRKPFLSSAATTALATAVSCEA